ncbi:MAG: serine hydrolase domain-containing protein [Ignavibacteriales bacterium]
MKKIIFLLLLLNFHLLSQTNQEDFGARFINAINSESEVEQKEIIINIFSQSEIDEVGVERLGGLVKQLHDNFAPIVYHHSEVLIFDKPEGMSYLMHIYAKQPDAVMWKDFQMRLDPELPHKLKSIGFIAEVSEPITLPNGSIEQKQTLDWLSGYLGKLKYEYDLYGSILIAKGEKILFKEYYGFADVEKKIPITNKTLFNVASGGKMFTALCIAKLVEINKLSYDDKITKYLTGFSDESKADKITIHHLLSHTSGISEYWSGQNDAAVYSATNIDDHLRLVLKSGFDFEPGTAYQYCNSNFILLGAIIEKVTGKSFYDFVQETIFNSAEMNQSGYFNHASNNTATPLARGENETDWIEAVHGIKGSSAGGSYSNTTDILKFSSAIKNNKIISKKTFQNMITSKNSGIKEPMDVDYGYGFILSKSSLELGYGHGGTADGVNFEFRYFPESDITFIMFCNQNNGAYDDLKKNTIKLITGER